MSKKETSPYDYQLQKIGDQREVTVSKITEDTAANIFGARARKPDQQVVLIWTKDLVPGKETRIGTITKPTQKVLIPRMNMYKYVTAYGNPRPGGKVKVASDERGFWKLVL